MKQHPFSLLIPCILLAAAPAFASHPDAEALTCADRSVSARAVRTTQDVQAFVQCAYEFVQEMGLKEAPPGLQRGTSAGKAGRSTSSSPKRHR